MGQTMGNLSDANVTDPSQAKWGDLDNSEKGARVMAGGIKGLSQGLQNYQGQNAAMGRGGGAVPLPSPQAPVSPDYFMPQQQQVKKNPFLPGG